jgi:hypothetical protein
MPCSVTVGVVAWIGCSATSARGVDGAVTGVTVLSGPSLNGTPDLIVRRAIVYQLGVTSEKVKFAIDPEDVEPAPESCIGAPAATVGVAVVSTATGGD